MLYGFKLSEIAEGAPYLELEQFKDIFKSFKPDITFGHNSARANFGEPRIKYELPLYHCNGKKTKSMFELSITSMCDNIIAFLIIAKNIKTSEKYIFRIDKRFLGDELYNMIATGKLNDDCFDNI